MLAVSLDQMESQSLELLSILSLLQFLTTLYFQSKELLEKKELETDQIQETHVTGGFSYVE